MAGGFESGQRLQLKKQISTMSIEKGRKIQIWTNVPGSLKVHSSELARVNKNFIDVSNSACQTNK